MTSSSSIRAALNTSLVHRRTYKHSMRTHKYARTHTHMLTLRHNGGGKGPLGYKGRKAAHMLAGAGQSAKISMLGAV
jgi:hypothetical protein